MRLDTASIDQHHTVNQLPCLRHSVHIVGKQREREDETEHKWHNDSRLTHTHTRLNNFIVSTLLLSRIRLHSFILFCMMSPSHLALFFWLLSIESTASAAQSWNAKAFQVAECSHVLVRG